MYQSHRSEGKYSQHIYVPYFLECTPEHNLLDGGGPSDKRACIKQFAYNPFFSPKSSIRGRDLTLLLSDPSSKSVHRVC